MRRGHQKTQKTRQRGLGSSSGRSRLRRILIDLLEMVVWLEGVEEVEAEVLREGAVVEPVRVAIHILLVFELFVVGLTVDGEAISEFFVNDMHGGHGMCRC